MNMRKRRRVSMFSDIRACRRMAWKYWGAEFASRLRLGRITAVFPDDEEQLLAEMSQPAPYYEGPIYSGKLGVIEGVRITTNTNHHDNTKRNLSIS